MDASTAKEPESSATKPPRRTSMQAAAAPLAYAVEKRTYSEFYFASAIVVAIGVVFMFVPDAMSEEEQADHESNKVHAIVSEAVLIILTGLVCCSLFFEGVQEFMEEHLNEVFLPVLNALNTELMGMGFLAVIFYFVLKFKALIYVGEATVCKSDPKYLNEDGTPVAAYHCDEKLIHMFEDIHMSLFLVLCLFFLRSVFLLYQVEIIKKHWDSMEDKINDGKIGEDGVLKEYHEVWSQASSTSVQKKLAQETVEFMLFRKQFLEAGAASGENKDLDADFSFSHYLSICCSHIATEIVEIPPIEWMALEVFFFLIWLALQMPPYLRIRFYLCYVFMGMILLLQLNGKVEWVLQMLVPPYPKAGTGDKKVLPTDDTPTKIGRPKYLEYTDGPKNCNKQEALFWFGNPELTLHILRFMILVMLIFLVVLINAIPFAINMGTEYVVMVLLPVPPVLAALVMVPHELMKDFSICVSVELLKNPKVIAKVCRFMRLKKSLRAIKVLRSLQSQKVCNAQDENTEVVAVDPNTLSAEDQMQYYNLKGVFDVFDMDKSGNVDLHELVGLMQALGISLEEDEKRNMMKECDKDNSGSISFDEFWTYMGRRSADLDANELVKDVFKMMDQDGSGSVTTSEFTDVMEKLGTDLTKREIQDLVKEIDSGGDNEISLEEFAAVLEKYK
jgi:Ca2+-binding EF-hand superfamily protein